MKGPLHLHLRPPSEVLFKHGVPILAQQTAHEHVIVTYFQVFFESQRAR